MKKINIVKANKDFNNIISLGNQTKNSFYVIYFEENNQNNYKFGISVPKKIGNAVIRNKIKRQLKNIIDNNVSLIVKKYNYIVIVRNKALELTYLEKEEELLKLLKKI